MKIKMLKTHADASGAHLAGQTYNLPTKEARILIKARAAVECQRKTLTNGSSTNSAEEKRNAAAVKILTSVTGIGKVTAIELVAKGITTLEQLAKANLVWSEDAAKMLEEEIDV